MEKLCESREKAPVTGLQRDTEWVARRRLVSLLSLLRWIDQLWLLVSAPWGRTSRWLPANLKTQQNVYGKNNPLMFPSLAPGLRGAETKGRAAHTSCQAPLRSVRENESPSKKANLDTLAQRQARGPPCRPWCPHAYLGTAPLSAVPSR